ncbi:hypothetical protein [Fuscovulum blasticum]|uniref:hypothetical protein n=1 Tax=Fuscovulum blasticum TaxID=1075 RepID=UPI000F50126F|nr:hypothetical protein [Fuscovulum blasticum]
MASDSSMRAVLQNSLLSEIFIANSVRNSGDDLAAVFGFEMSIATLSQDFVAAARQPTLLASPVFHPRLLDNVDEVAALTQALNDLNIFPHGIDPLSFFGFISNETGDRLTTSSAPTAGAA